MEAIFADSAGVRPATHSGTRYWLGLALVRDGQEERGLAMMEQAHCEFAYMDWDEMEAFAAKGLLGIYASRHLGSRMLEFYPRYAALQDSLNEKTSCAIPLRPMCVTIPDEKSRNTVH